MINKNEQKYLEIEKILNDLQLNNFEILQDFSVNINGHVNLKNRQLTYLPLVFNEIKGGFSCSNNQLTSLKGSPRIVHGEFNCSCNQLKTLHDAPQQAQSMDCSNNHLQDLTGMPKIENYIIAENNQLTSLKGISSTFSGALYIGNNPLKSLKYLPNNLPALDARNTKLSSLKGLPKKIESLNLENTPLTESFHFPEEMEYLYLQNTGINILELLKKHKINIKEHVICDILKDVLEKEPHLVQEIKAGELCIRANIWNTLNLAYFLTNEMNNEQPSMSKKRKI